MLFNLDTIEEELEASFPNPPVLNQLKGDPEKGTMTMLLIPATTHLFEPVYPETVDATIEWFKAITDYAGDYPQTYLVRELLIALAFVFFIASIIVSFTIDAVMVEPQGMDRLSGVVYGLVGFLIFLPAMLLGNILSFPPQVFGSSIAWWLMIWGIVIYLVTVIWRREKIELSLRRGDVVYALLVFVAGYIFCSGLEYVFGFGFRLLVPIMRMLSLKRVGSFLIYIPFIFIHFHSESNWFKTQTSSIQGLIASKLGIFTAIILAQYGGFYLPNIVLVGGFVGFILEFLVAIVPMLLISGLFTAYAQRYNRLGASVILNALLFSWIAAGLFPY